MDVVVVVATQVHFTRVRDLLLERFPERSLRHSWPAQGVLVFAGAPGPVVDLICGEELDLLFLGGKMGPNLGQWGTTGTGTAVFTQCMSMGSAPAHALLLQELLWGSRCVLRVRLLLGAPRLLWGALGPKFWGL